jgi:hypothetical protein
MLLHRISLEGREEVFGYRCQYSRGWSIGELSQMTGKAEKIKRTFSNSVWHD